MTTINREYEEKTLSLSLEFSKYMLEHDEFDDQIPENATVVLLPKTDPEYCEYVKQQVRLRKLHNEPVVFIEFDGLQPERLSRLINPHLIELVHA